MSFVPKRIAFRRPSRPKALFVVAPVTRVRLELMVPVEAPMNGVTDVGSTLPLCETIADPKVMPPPIVIRTGGRGGFRWLAEGSVRSHVLRNGSHKFGISSQLTPPVSPVPATGHAARELRHGRRGIPTASIVAPPTLQAIRTG